MPLSRVVRLASGLFAAAAVAAIAAVAAFGRRAPSVAGEREAPPRITLAPEPSLPDPPDLRPPTPREVQAAVRRVFESALPAERVAAHRALAADLNGDGAPDLVVPAVIDQGCLAALTSPLANWTVQDAAAAPLGPGPHPSPLAPALHAGETVLAVVHGYGPRGWRDSRARQAYLIKAGKTTPLLARSPVSVGGTARGHLRLLGDVLVEPEGRRFVYWTGARYAWHPPPAPSPASRRTAGPPVGESGPLTRTTVKPLD
jgi:hypothetical protein